MEVNPQRNQVKGKIGNTEFILSATFEHIQNMESYLKRDNPDCSFLKVTRDFSDPNGRLFTYAETASLIFIAQESEPKLSVNRIGDLLVKHGIKPGLDMLGEFLKISLAGTESEVGNDEAKVSP